MIINVSSSGSGGSNIIKSATMPSGVQTEGVIWYNTSNGKLFTYVADVGFVPSAPSLGLLKLQSTYFMPNTVNTAQDFTIPINLDYTTSDILEVNYEGLTLSEGQHYNVNSANDTITLLGFTTQQNDLVSFTVTKIVDMTSVSSISDEMYDSITRLDNHISSKASGTNSSHVLLSDTISESDVNDGIAATPKAVMNSRLITDLGTNLQYQLGMENGRIFLEEV